MLDLVVLGIIVIILSIPIAYLVKQKKKGNKCVGCPYAQNCNKKNKNC